MTSLILPSKTWHAPEVLGARLRGEPGHVILRSACFELPQARYSMVSARPFLTLRAYGSQCELHRPGAATEMHFGNPWRLLDRLLAQYELLDEVDLPFPLGFACGIWGYDLRCFVEPHLRTRARRNLPLPDCWIGFYDSLVVFDHRTSESYIVATGLQPDGSRDSRSARRAADWWRSRLETLEPSDREPPTRTAASRGQGSAVPSAIASNLDREGFCRMVERAQRYIRAGDVYQVNLSQRFSAAAPDDPWEHWQRLTAVSPAPFSAFFDTGDFQLASISPELFLRLSGHHIVTRPIKGTRPRAADPTLDAQLTYELQTSPKELAELVMITDLLRNDLGRVCEYGSIQVPDLLRLERYSTVQHLVSTVEGRLRPGITHLAALEACYPGGSITGAPKIRAMEIIDELEPEARGLYTGCAGYLGFNRESQLSILIRTSIVHEGQVWYHAGAGIVADSIPIAEYNETMSKARAFFAAVGCQDEGVGAQPQTLPQPLIRRRPFDDPPLP